MENMSKLYQNKINKEFNNNRMIYTSYDNNDIEIVNDSNDVRKKINDIVNSPNFIYRTKVNIVIGNDIISRKIVGVYNNNLVTIDNEHIPIENIKDIYR